MLFAKASITTFLGLPVSEALRFQPLFSRALRALYLAGMKTSHGVGPSSSPIKKFLDASLPLLY
jgi:hypothetical protein